jgi:quercetin 2,3-dioxygenase
LLTSYRSFNIPNYYSPDYEHFGSICILNEDIVAPSSGFSMHSHRGAPRYLSYILSGGVDTSGFDSQERSRE